MFLVAKAMWEHGIVPSQPKVMISNREHMPPAWRRAIQRAFTHPHTGFCDTMEFVQVALKCPLEAGYGASKAGFNVALAPWARLLSKSRTTLGSPYLPVGNYLKMRSNVWLPP